jgi:hypothetical protein
LDELELRVQQAAELSFEDMHIKFEPAAGRPMVLGAIVQGIALELVVCAADSQWSRVLRTPC